MSDAYMLETGAGARNLEAGGYRAVEGVPAVGTDVLLEPFNNLTAWSNSGCTIVTGRTGTAAQAPGNVSATANWPIPSAGQSDTVIIGFAWRTASISSEHQIIMLNSDAGATQHTRLRVNGAGSLLVFRASSGLFATAAGLIAINTWNYVELQVKLHDTTGAFDLHLNGVSVGSATNVDTKNAGTKTVYDTVQIGTDNFFGDNLYDDMYVTTGAGAPFKGPITIP